MPNYPNKNFPILKEKCKNNLEVHCLIYEWCLLMKSDSIRAMLIVILARMLFIVVSSFFRISYSTSFYSSVSWLHLCKYLSSLLSSILTKFGENVERFQR